MPRVGRGRFPLVLIPSILFCLLFMPPRKAAAPPDPPEAAPSPHPARWAPEQQPAPVHNPSGRPNSKWRVQALVCRKGTGKAVNTTIHEKSPRIYAATADLALIEQQKFINEYIHAVKRQKKDRTSGGSSSAAGSSSSEPIAEPIAPRPSRAAAPKDLKEEQVYAGGPRAGSARAGPGVSASQHGAVLSRPWAVLDCSCWSGCVRAPLDAMHMPRPEHKRFTYAQTRLVDVRCRVLLSQAAGRWRSCSPSTRRRRVPSRPCAHGSMAASPPLAHR